MKFLMMAMLALFAFGMSPVFAEETIDLLVSPLIGKILDPNGHYEVFIVRDVKNSLGWHSAHPDIDGLDYVERNTYLISAKKSFTFPLVEPPKYELVEIKRVFKSHTPYNNACAPGYHVWVDGDCVFAFRCSEHTYPGKLCIIDSRSLDYLRPLQQEKAGMPSEDVICLEPLHLVIKPDSGSACVNSSSVDKLLERGFTLDRK
jgi:hypothetical protein